MKKLILALCLIIIASCSGATKGVGLGFIREQFNLPSSNPVIVDINDSNSCPKIEFHGDTDFYIRFEEGNPQDSQSRFKYEDDEFKQMGEMRVLRGKNESASTFEFTFDNDVTYTLTIDYNCPNATDEGCVNTTYSCSGPLQ
ncbi:MAG: hypothetical protein IT286_05375 [Proteobacteria bacterium]|jgi:hypothetical protein|nr:hypothetical protein [Pseudomonadota bacterium]